MKARRVNISLRKVMIWVLSESMLVKSELVHFKQQFIWLTDTRSCPAFHLEKRTIIHCSLSHALNHHLISSWRKLVEARGELNFILWDVSIVSFTLAPSFPFLSLKNPHPTHLFLHIDPHQRIGPQTFREAHIPQAEGKKKKQRKCAYISEYWFIVFRGCSVLRNLIKLSSVNLFDYLSLLENLLII